VRKTEENLQDVPLAVTALTAETLERGNVQQLSDVANLTPGLVFFDFNVGALSTPVIRGLAQSNTAGRENNVGMFLDGIYLPNRNNLDLELLDLQRVEIVKGPQSALYGRSTFAGSINYVTKAPSDQLDVTVQGSLGTDEYLDTKVNVSGPITDTLSGTAALSYREFDGTINNLASLNNLGGYENTSGMAKLQWSPTEEFTGTLTAFYTEKKTESSGIFNVEPNCGSTPPGMFGPGGDPSYTCGTLPFRENVSVNPLATGGDGETSLVSLDLQYDFGSVLLTSITSYTDSKFSAVTDYDADAAGVAYNTAIQTVPFPIFGAPVTLNNLSFRDSDDKTLSQEFRLEGGNDTFTWLTGVYWTSEESSSSQTLTLSGATTPNDLFPGFLNLYVTNNPLQPNLVPTQATADVDIYALFARGQWNINDRSRVSLEGRYTYEDKEINGISSFFGLPSGIQSNDWSYFAPRLTYSYDLTDSMLLYGSAAGGTKSGGFNTAYSALFPEEQFYDEETNITYELGAKGTLVDDRLRYDVAVFYVDWEDLQISGASQDPQFQNAIVSNAGAATSKGIEIQLDGIVNDWLTLGGGYAYADPTFSSGVTDSSIATACGDGTLCTTDVGGQQVGRTVKNQLNLYADLHSKFNQDWDWYARADYIYRDKQPTRSANLQFIDDWKIVNARVGLANQNWDIALWAKNLTDEGNVTSQIRQPRLNDFSLPTTVIEANLRQVALTVTYRL
jgi:iron complex outermembrane receptor protein